MQSKINIRSLDKETFQKELEGIGINGFRTKQVYSWLWQKSVASFEEMTNLSKEHRNLLEQHFFIDKIALSDQQISSDKTIKSAFEVEKGKVVEGVLIPTTSRMTACISSQVGCSLSCTFCATGRLKLMRNLTPGEIYDQVVYLKNQAEINYQIPLSNIVMMGMGEPLLNYKNVMYALDRICSEDGLGISPKRVTLSTAGIAKMIRKMGDDQVKFNLALSLHAANDVKRSKIMEINDSNNLEVLTEALEYFHEKTGSRITFEYIIFKDFNDKLEDAQELAKFARCVPNKINIIEYNSIENGEFQQADSENVKNFVQFLESKNMIVNVRRSRGKDIDAACGQLANKNKLLTSPVFK